MPLCGSARPPDRTPVRSFIFGDVRKVTGDLVCKVAGIERGELDVILGGPPCQGFSTAGKRHVMDPRNSLVFEMARLINELNPKCFVMENVPGIQTMQTPEGLPVIDAFCAAVAEGGYASYDSLRKSMLGKGAARAAMRTPDGKKKARTEEERTEEETAQTELEL